MELREETHKRMKIRATIRKNAWSSLSLVITLVSAFLIDARIQYLYFHGAWSFDSGEGRALSAWGSLCVLLSVGTAIVGLIRDTNRVWGIVAICLGAASFFLYVQ